MGRAAVSAADPAACGAPGAAEPVDECVAQAARELAVQGRGEEARSACQGLAGGPWRDECFFLVTDTLDLRGDEARRACQDAGQWRQQCVGHAMARDAHDIMAELGLGHEDEATERIVQEVATYVGARQAEPRARAILADELAGRAEGALSALDCGTAARDLCRDAYSERVRRAAGGQEARWRQACGRTVDRQRVEAAGLPAWEPDMEPVALDAWKRLCER